MSRVSGSCCRVPVAAEATPSPGIVNAFRTAPVESARRRIEGRPRLLQVAPDLIAWETDCFRSKGGIKMTRHQPLSTLVVLGALALCREVPSWLVQFPEARIFIEYNSTDNDLGFHVKLDAENWKTVTILNPAGNVIFEVAGKGAFGALGLSELF